jgi:3-oxoacyl-[acyl-carrier-protein] synthase II
MRRRVVITGTGIISALGDDAAGLHASICEGRCAFSEERFEDWAELPPARTARIKDFTATKWLGDVNTRPLERAGQLSICAALLALESSGWTIEKRKETEIDLVLATAFGPVETIARYDRDARLFGPKHAKPLDFANTVINAPAGQTAIWHGLTGSNLTVCAGKIASLCALRDAARRIANGWSTTVLTGGVEAVSFETYAAFSKSGQMQPDAVSAHPAPFSFDRRGFLLGEGSAFIVLEEAEAAEARGATIRAELSGCGSSYDPAGGQDQRSAIDACVRAIKGALSHAGTARDAIDFICASACGSVAGDAIEIMALSEVFGDRLAELPLFAPAAALGETLGASGMIQTVLLIESALAGWVPGTAGAERYDPRLPAAGVSATPRRGNYRHGLSISQGFTGSSAAVVVTINS